MGKDRNKKPEPIDKALVAGVLVTAFYLGMIGTYSVQNWERITRMEPNNFGDYLAGVFGPLAFAWLVIGYFQQGRELRMQAEELRNSVEQQKDLVRESAKQVRASEAALEYEKQRALESSIPRLEFRSCGHTRNNIYTVHLTPRNSDIFNIEVEIISDGWELVYNEDSCLAGAKWCFQMQPKTNAIYENMIDVAVSFDGHGGKSYHDNIHLTSNGAESFVPVSERHLLAHRLES